MIDNNKKQITIIKCAAGFTLVEMLVSIAIFLSVMIIAVGSLVSIIDANGRSQGIKSVVDNVTFAIESISRDMRNGSNYICLNAINGTVNTSCSANGSDEVSYISSDNLSTVYYRFLKTPKLGEGNIQKCVDTGGGCPQDPTNSISWQSMTAPISVVDLTNMTFYVLGTGTKGGTPTSRQPRVIITAQGTIKDKNGNQTDFNLQTTASQRVRQTFSQ